MYHSSIKLVLALDCLVRSIRVYFLGGGVTTTAGITDNWENNRPLWAKQDIIVDSH